MDNKKVNFLEKEEFNEFYRKMVEVVLDASANPNKDNVTIDKLMKEANLAFDVEPLVLNAVKPALYENLYAPSKSAANGCAACSICAICAICGTINGAAGVIGLAGIIGFASTQILMSER